MRKALLGAAWTWTMAAALAYAAPPDDAPMAANDPLPIGGAGAYGAPQASPPFAYPTPTPPGLPIGPPPMPNSLQSNTPNAFGDPGPSEPPCSWITLDYLHWWVSRKLPPLVTTNPGPSAGILGNPDTSTLFGGSEDEIDHSGLRGSIGYWFPHTSLGVEAQVDYLIERTSRFDTSSDANGSPILSRPVINALHGDETAEFISYPNQFSGAVSAMASTMFWNAQINLMIPGAPDSGDTRLFVGPRYADLEESLSIQQRSTALADGLIGHSGTFFGAGTVATIADQFDTRNQFIGGQVGAQGRLEREGGKAFLQLRGSLGVGYTYESVTVRGLTTITPPGSAPMAFEGGLLALPTNSGHYTHEKVSLLPEGEISVGWHLSEHLDITVGYDLLYWSDVLRPQNRIDRVVNPTQLPTSVQSTAFSGPAQPMPLRDTDFFAQGLTVGLSVRY